MPPPSDLRDPFERGVSQGGEQTGDLPVIDSRASFAAAVRMSIERAADTGQRELVLVDPDFLDWPLADGAVLAALSRWAGPKREIWMVAHAFDALMAAPRMARFVTWRRTWAHLFHVHAAPAIDRSEIPSLLLAGSHSLQRMDLQHSRGRWLTAEDDRRAWRDVVDAILQRSEVAFPAHTLGL